jgi:NTP pyrophosphatase (non-canonical NTP hydrolase)
VGKEAQLSTIETFKEYQELTRRTAPKNVEPIGTERAELINYMFGLWGEMGELTDYMKKILFHDHVPDWDRLEEEIGDILWYLARISDFMLIRMGDVAGKNIDKLKKRYPNGFNPKDSINRTEYQKG